MTHTAEQHLHLPDPPRPVLAAPNSPWALEGIVDRLEVLWKTTSATDIANILSAEFNIAITRNSVIGRLHRMGVTGSIKTKLHPRDRRTRNPAARPKQNRPKLHIVANGGGGLRVMQSWETDLSPLRGVEVAPLRISLLELDHNTCRYPYRDTIEGPTTFCGHPRFGKFPYCGSHAALSYRPLEARER